MTHKQGLGVPEWVRKKLRGKVIKYLSHLQLILLKKGFKKCYLSSFLGLKSIIYYYANKAFVCQVVYFSYFCVC